MQDTTFVTAGVLAVLTHFALRGALPELSPVMLLVAASAAIALAALDASVLAARLRGDRGRLPLVAGLFASGLLLMSEHGRVLEWRLASSHVPGLGLVFGVLLLSVLGGTLLLGADRLTGFVSAHAGIVGRRMLMLAAALGVIAIGLAAQDAVPAAPGALSDLADLGAGVVAATWGLAFGCVSLLSGDADGDSERAEARATRLIAGAATVAAVALVVAGVYGWWQEGSYLVGATRSVLIATLAGFAAVQPTGLRFVRALLFTGALVAALVA